MRESPRDILNARRSISPPALNFLTPIVCHGSRGITAENVVELSGNKPNIQVLGATQPEALSKYQNATQILTF